MAFSKDCKVTLLVDISGFLRPGSDAELFMSRLVPYMKFGVSIKAVPRSL